MPNGELDPHSGVPLYRQIKEILRTEISSGDMDAETPMTEAQLLERFGVSRAPIRQALRDLTDEGYVYRKQGKGTFPVPGRRVSRPADVPSGELYRHLATQGMQPSSRVEGIARVVPPERVRQRLSIPDTEELLHFTRLISVQDSPLVYSRVYLRTPADFLPTTVDLEEKGSAFELLDRNFGITLERSEHQAWATGASDADAAQLDVSPGSPLLAIETLFLTTGGMPAGMRLAMHRSEQFKYHFVTNR